MCLNFGYGVLLGFGLFWFCFGFFPPKENTLLLDAAVIFGIPFENQPTEGVFVYYYYFN